MATCVATCVWPEEGKVSNLHGAGTLVLKFCMPARFVAGWLLLLLAWTASQPSNAMQEHSNILQPYGMLLGRDRCGVYQE